MEMVKNIFSIHIPRCEMQDECYWTPARDGKFSVKSAYFPGVGMFFTIVSTHQVQGAIVSTHQVVLQKAMEESQVLHPVKVAVDGAWKKDTWTGAVAWCRLEDRMAISGSGAEFFFLHARLSWQRR